MFFNGIEILPSPLLTETVTETRRVKGGYCNRWLLRQIVTETRPSRRVIHLPGENVMVCHPAVLEEIRRSIPLRSNAI